MGDLHYMRPVDDPRSDLERAFSPPWHEDIYQMAKLWRWLVFRELRPKDPAHFFTHGLEYREEYEAMQLWTGAAE